MSREPRVKGSTCAMLSAILQAAGYRVGLFTSPHLERVEERLQVDGVPIGRAELAAQMEEVVPAVRQLEGEPGSPRSCASTGAGRSSKSVQALGLSSLLLEAMRYLPLLRWGWEVDSIPRMSAIHSFQSSHRLDSIMSRNSEIHWRPLHFRKRVSSSGESPWYVE